MNVYGGDCTMQFVCHSYVTEKKTLAHHSLMWLSGKGIRPQNSEFLLRAGSLWLIGIIIRFWETVHLPLPYPVDSF